MGLYDREYSRGPEPGFHVSAPVTATMQLIAITFGVYLLQILSPTVDEYFSLTSDWFRRPWEAYRLLTYGFLHSVARVPHEPGVLHIIGNMFALFLFGRDIEYKYGRRRFLVFYLSAIVVGGFVWSASEAGAGQMGMMIGASGAVSAVIVLFALNFPHREVLLYFAIPIPMWVFGLFIVAQDVFGAIRQNGNVAFTAHLGGAAFGLLFYKTGWLPGGRWFQGLQLPNWKRKPRLRVHEPDEEDDLSQKVDAILQKIQEQGQESLTWSERRTLEKASRQYQEKRK
jgi:membrane associated rhomboid family serine protease